MPDLLLDIETRSRVDLKKYGVYRYAECPDFRILMCAWTMDGRTVPVETSPEAIYEIPGLWDPDVRKVAHNAAFERICFSAFRRLPPGTYLDPRHWHDTQAVAGAQGWPQKLETLTQALGAPLKDSAGTALINWFCKPDRNGNFRRPEDHPEKWEQFKAYCAQDVRALAGVHLDLGELPNTTERNVYVVDQLINDRGLPIDVPMARAAVAAAVQNKAEQEAEFRRLTGVDNPNSGPQVHAWAKSTGLHLPDLQAETVEALLAGDSLDATQRRVMELRQELALVAYKKFNTALNAVTVDDRLRGGFFYFGAHTGRWAGRGVQPHNMPRASFYRTDPITGEKVFDEAAQFAAILDLAIGLGADAQVLKKLVRALFVGPFTVVDYAAIEARVIAWLFGELWALKAFRDGRDIYVEQASRMGPEFGRPDGKIATLALGFQGAVNSLRVMGATGTDAELRLIVDRYRQTNPNIVNGWHDLGRAFRTGGKVGQFIEVVVDGKDRWIKLPSGRAIGYHRVGFRTEEGPYGPRTRASFEVWKNGRRYRQDTYGGRLAENVTQGTARDVLAEGLVRLERAGYRTVGHVHDEAIVEGKDVEGVKALMCKSPRWAKGLPIDADGFVTERYRKG